MISARRNDQYFPAQSGENFVGGDAAKLNAISGKLSRAD
jgi:hypothetical protein